MKKNKKIRRASAVIDGAIIETIHFLKEHQTAFAIFENNEIRYESVFKNDGKELYPLDGESDLIRKKVVLLPGRPEEYGTEADLIRGITNFIHKYLDISEMFEKIASYYVLFSWIYDRFNEVPYLRALGDFGSGKSRFLRVVGSTCYLPIFTGGATTPSPIFRILSQTKGTLILDEADFKSSEMSDDIIKILNTGYERGIPVLRSEGKGEFEVKAYDVFSPKIIATRELFKDRALESRCLVEQMGKSNLRHDIPRRLNDSFYEEALAIRSKLLMWRFKNYHKELKFDDALIEGVHPRLHQIVIPLLTIIDSEEMKKDLREFVKKYNEELISDRGQTWESDAVLAILKLAELRKENITVKEITEVMNAALDINDEKLQSRKVGWILRTKLQLKTHKTRDGFVLPVKKNAQRLDFWKERFGITDESIKGSEQVNVVNDTTDKEIIPEQLSF